MARYSIIHSKAYKKSIKKFQKSDLELIENIIARLANNEVLESKYRVHKLQGKYSGLNECHIKPDLLLTYQKCEIF
ncbi:type II toxin-antitoxin system YafQ family toxin [Helicobacter bilis]|uniref:type II toxin-antitoxin system RelE/ParE family toxin n=1 Tax=Helicobacter bilis TaxID=37372 RepID=UPI00248E24EC|nr:type II toxin-antitoxin system YafQ family toxin [Helicobacter bilis]